MENQAWVRTVIRVDVCCSASVSTLPIPSRAYGVGGVSGMSDVVLLVRWYDTSKLTSRAIPDASRQLRSVMISLYFSRSKLMSSFWRVVPGQKSRASWMSYLKMNVA